MREIAYTVSLSKITILLSLQIFPIDNSDALLYCGKMITVLAVVENCVGSGSMLWWEGSIVSLSGNVTCVPEWGYTLDRIILYCSLIYVSEAVLSKVILIVCLGDKLEVLE